MLSKVRLDERHLSGVDRGNASFVSVNADHADSMVRQDHSGRETDVPQPDHRDDRFRLIHCYP